MIAPAVSVARLLVIGAVNGKFREVFAKVAPLHAKNAFSLAIVIGDLFANPESHSEEDEAAIDDLLEGRIPIALTTHFMLGRHPLPSRIIEKLEEADGEVCENLFFLGKRTTFKTSEGTRIVALGGTFDAGLNAASSKDKYAPFYNAGDAKALRGAHSADLLLTTDWPQNVHRGSRTDTEWIANAKTGANEAVADLCAALKPRYHFSASPSKFFEREPFFHAAGESSGGSSDGHVVTRFISVAPFGNTEKQKWIYAFSLDAASSSAPVIPAGATASPFSTSAGKKRLAPQEEAFSRFSSDNNSHQQRAHKRRQRGPAAAAPPPGPSECFFCLSNPNLASHLVTSIGEDAYLTTAKGPLTTRQTFSGLSFPGHMLIIPLAHTPTLHSLGGDGAAAVRRSTCAEMIRYRSALNRMLRCRSSAALGSVTWEVSRQGGIHTHWQFLPVSRELVQRGLVEAAFKVEAENLQYPSAFAVSKHLSRRLEDELIAAAGDSFRVWIWSARASDGNKQETKEEEEKEAGEETMLELPLDASFKFDLQFGRRVLSKLLGLDARLNWRECGQSEAEEAADAESFKEAFKQFDFTLV